MLFLVLFCHIIYINTKGCSNYDAEKENNKGYKINTNGTVRKAGKKHRLNDAEEYAKLNGYDSYKEMEEIELNR